MRRPCPGRAPSSAAVLLAAACAVALTASPALAHTSLAASTPPEGATVAQPVDVVQLAFTSAVSTAPAQVVVTAPDGTDVAQGPARVTGATVSTSVGSWPAAGTYRLAYRVLAADGHPITGQVSFTVDPSAVRSSAAEAPSGADSPDSVPAPGSDSVPAASVAPPAADEGGGWLVPGLAAGLVGAGLALGIGLVRSGRRSGAGP